MGRLPFRVRAWFRSWCDENLRAELSRPGILAGAKDAVMSGGEAEDGSGKHIRGMVGLQGDPRETHARGETVSDPGAPARIRIAIRKDGGNGKRRNRVPGRETPDASDNVAGMASEPGVGKVTVPWNLDGFHAAIDIFHDAGENFGAQDSLTRKQERALRVGIFSQQVGAVECNREGKHGDGSISAAEGSIEAAEGPSALKVFTAGYIDRRNDAGGDGGKGERRLEMTPPRQGDGKQPDVLLVVHEVRNQFQPRDGSFGKNIGRGSIGRGTGRGFAGG
jgi:hypothetical protein